MSKRVSRTASPSGAPYEWEYYTESADRVFENELDQCLEARCRTQLQFDAAHGEIEALHELAARGQLIDTDDRRATPVQLDPELWELRWSMGSTDQLRLYHGEPPGRPTALLALKVHWKWLAVGAQASEVRAAQNLEISEASQRYRRTGLHPTS